MRFYCLKIQIKNNEVSFLFSSIFLFNHLFNINCLEDDDLDIVISVNDGKSRIEAFKSKENDLILKFHS